MKTSSVYMVIMSYLKYHVNTIIATHNIEEELPRYGKSNFKVYHNAGTYSREFRRIRQLKLHHGLDLVPYSTSKEKSWQILNIPI